MSGKIFYRERQQLAEGVGAELVSLGRGPKHEEEMK
ncbi:MAG: hypothetical protein H6Q57_2347 [Geobacteraceae bacterium]|nr:hypothetical protein [Geobacteraceae bacterium]